MQLARQIHVALIAAILLATAGFGLVVLLTSEQLELALLDTMIRSEAELFTERLRQDPQATLPRHSLTEAWFEPHKDVPAVLQQLPLGSTHDVALGSRRYHVLRQMLDQGVLTVAVDIQALEQREAAMRTAVLISGVVITVMLLALAWFISQRVAAPLQQLAGRLNALSPDELSSQSLAGQFTGAEVEVIAEALDAYIQRLADMVERERGFASSASHELRSPMTVIRSSLELLLMDSQLSPQMQQVAQRAENSCERLVQVLDGLMMLARDDHSDAQERVDACQAVAELIEEIRPHNPDTPISLHCDAEQIHLHCSEAMLRMLVSNLLRNAQDHAHGKAVTLRLSEHWLCVEDQGPGIAPELLPRIFERSHRGMDSSGAGLGLYIASEICQRHGWSIHAENLHPRGCRIQVRFQTSDVELATTRA